MGENVAHLRDSASVSRSDRGAADGAAEKRCDRQYLQHHVGACDWHRAGVCRSQGRDECSHLDLAALYGPAGVRVVSIQPGAVDTTMSNDYSAKTDQGGFEKRVRDWSEDMIALRRWARPEEIARAIVAISGDDASYLTGTIVTVDGGWSHQLWPFGLKHEQHPDQFP